MVLPDMAAHSQRPLHRCCSRGWCKPSPQCASRRHSQGGPGSDPQASDVEAAVDCSRSSTGQETHNDFLVEFGHAAAVLLQFC